MSLDHVVLDVICRRHVFSGGVRLRRELVEERHQHHGRLHVVPLHLCRHRSPTVQRTLLLLHGRLQEHETGLHVSHAHSILQQLLFVIDDRIPQQQNI